MSSEVRIRFSLELQKLLVTKLPSKNEGRIIKLFVCRYTKLFLNTIKILFSISFSSLQLGQTVTELLQLLCSSSWS